MSDEASTLTVTEFVEARIAEDEANIEGDWAAGDGGLHIISTPMHDRMVAQCAAMREVVGFAKHLPSVYARSVIEPLASIWSDHPSWREEWRA
jgi:hypothetical protein